MSFQTSVNPTPAPGIAGDFASTNPRHSSLSGPGGFVAGPNGLICGRFAWADPATYSILNNAGQGKPSGFVRNSHNALITLYLGETSLTIPQGFSVGSLFDSGDFWLLNTTGLPVTPGQKCYVNNNTGQVSSFAAAATPTTAGTSTASAIAASTFSVTGAISIPVAGATLGPGVVPAVLTVTAVGSGTIVPGATISGTGVVSGTTIVAQLTGTAGGIGTYSVSIAQTVASTTVSGTYGTLTVGGTVVAGYAVNQTLTGSGVVAGTYITALISGTGAAGTYAVSNNTIVSSTAINSYIGTESDWFAASFGSGAAGEVVKIQHFFP